MRQGCWQVQALQEASQDGFGEEEEKSGCVAKWCSGSIELRQMKIYIHQITIAASIYQSSFVGSSHRARGRWVLAAGVLR